MVAKVHRYANGGKIVKNHLADGGSPEEYESRVVKRTFHSPGVKGAVKDATNALGREAARILMPSVYEDLNIKSKKAGRSGIVRVEKALKDAGA